MHSNLITQTLETLSIKQAIALGNDLVYLPNFKQSFSELFKAKVYTDKEISYCNQFEDSLLRYASTWAAKEAVYKALKQLGAAVAGWQNIEILRDKIAGKPSVTLHKFTNKLNISLSISHDGDYVWAVALVKY